MVHIIQSKLMIKAHAYLAPLLKGNLVLIGSNVQVVLNFFCPGSWKVYCHHGSSDAIFNMN